MEKHSERGQIIIEVLVMSLLFAALIAFFQFRANQNDKQFKKHRFSHAQQEQS